MKQGLLAGLVGGIGLGLLLRGIQQVTGAKVYTLLLNIDFVPGLPDRLAEWQEFLLHLAVSLPLGILYMKAADWSLRPAGCGVLLGLLVGVFTWFTLTPLSDRTPSLSDVEALVYWLGGHLLYGASLALFYKQRWRTST